MTTASSDEKRSESVAIWRNFTEMLIISCFLDGIQLGADQE
jgi:hypothetical protein